MYICTETVLSNIVQKLGVEIHARFLINKIVVLPEKMSLSKLKQEILKILSYIYYSTLSEVAQLSLK